MEYFHGRSQLLLHFDLSLDSSVSYVFYVFGKFKFTVYYYT